jgi:methylphosphotriester-DNA--protein-cysteine methyltransferase
MSKKESLSKRANSEGVAVLSDQEVEGVVTAMYAQRQQLAQIITLLQNASNEFGAIAADIGASNKRSYTDRLTDKVKPWGVHVPKIASHLESGKELISKAQESLKTLKAQPETLTIA